MDGNLTASDVALLTGNNRNDGMFGGDGAWWLIVLFLFAFCGWENNGWGNNGNGGGYAATAATTPAAVDQYNNVSSGIYIDVPRGCCVNIAVENTSDQAISVANANIVVTREA